ncbi:MULTISPECIES: response regulator [unclassified Chelatococcus]|uniref:sensor histidine kinase n=1 Tax=unclassified Chelatococcus TaxID=2638111 RepID=UPI001BD0E6F1|nr:MULTISPECIES: response regulator [unclassified Chelatococcus]CAH1671395.1 Response regulator [Hyphomicrobiales bacterium]MBS7739085.1 response regulator [Chelatococcus sp. HY11]MBX3543520.1 response regulator [Chelatococcus sp.]MCO5076385.1 response regulator [Chelatococcus sp.]CAH1676404.1 Response regulator [Hyphomicrobiales bacterium]
MPLSIRRVLYIDDDPGMGRLVQKALARRGFEVELATDADSGLDLIDQGDFHVVALDHFLPTGTGLDVLEVLRGRQGAPPVVYVTASAETTVAVQALKAGAVDYVPKTIAAEFLELLTSAIDQAIQNARLKRAKEIAEQEVREARDRAEALLAEVNHRVANSLAIVSSMVRYQLKAIEDPVCRAALAETDARILAVAGVHRRLYTSANVRSVAIDEYLQGLVSDLASSMRQAGHRSQLRVETSPGEVPTDRAVSIGVLVTELVTNAFKYAYPEGGEGDILVRLSCEDDTARITVEDEGIGWHGEGAPKGTGLGSRIVQSMARSLGGELFWLPRAKGTAVGVSFPLLRPA